MDLQKIEMFIAQNAKKFPQEQLPNIKSLLENADDSKSMVIQSLSLQDPTIILVLAILFPIERVLLGQVGLGLLKIFTAGGFIIWHLIDIFSATKRAKTYNFKKLMEVL